jgi:hypothetical protein
VINAQQQLLRIALTSSKPPRLATQVATLLSGLGNHEVTLSLYMSYAASETYATLSALVGTTTTITVKPTSGVASPTDPGFILSGAFLAELPVISATMGELSTVDVTFVGGDYSVSTS